MLMLVPHFELTECNCVSVCLGPMRDAGSRFDCLLLQINWAMNDKQEFVDITEVVYRGARKGRGLVVSPKGMPCLLGHIKALGHK